MPQLLLLSSEFLLLSSNLVELLLLLCVESVTSEGYILYSCLKRLDTVAYCLFHHRTTSTPLSCCYLLNHSYKFVDL